MQTPPSIRRLRQTHGRGPPGGARGPRFGDHAVVTLYETLPSSPLPFPPPPVHDSRQVLCERRLSPHNSFFLGVHCRVSLAAAVDRDWPTTIAHAERALGCMRRIASEIEGVGRSPAGAIDRGTCVVGEGGDGIRGGRGSDDNRGVGGLSKRRRSGGDERDADSFTTAVVSSECPLLATAVSARARDFLGLFFGTDRPNCVWPMMWCHFSWGQRYGEGLVWCELFRFLKEGVKLSSLSTHVHCQFHFLQRTHRNTQIRCMCVLAKYFGVFCKYSADVRKNQPPPLNLLIERDQWPAISIVPRANIVNDPVLFLILRIVRSDRLQVWEAILVEVLDRVLPLAGRDCERETGLHRARVVFAERVVGVLGLRRRSLVTLPGES